ncbi:MAG: Mth938-like domain-containing protein [Proteobacteria bacterium]|nr:Mth938-like domain-containing protein [Pseudomonadota bacterium]
MDISPIAAPGSQVIETYGDGRFRISGRTYAGSVIVLPERTESWAVAAFADITWESLRPVVEAAPGVGLLIVGCGRRAEPVAAEHRRRLREAGIVAEAMDTGAACRTFNVLVSEDRRVAAALIAV